MPLLSTSYPTPCSAKQMREDAERQRQGQIQVQEMRDERANKEKRNQEAARRAASAADRATKSIASLERSTGEWLGYAYLGTECFIES